MASKEVPRPKEYAETGFSTVQPTLKQHLDNATAALLFKNFDACIEHCENGLSQVKLCTDRENFRYIYNVIPPHFELLAENTSVGSFISI